ncbi:IucC family-domain-containing protein [Aspergillus pseudoustus]|uniref:IucC family-domain-containing protein n=1 Tax=Aspergillus pseudoustus TaxID=1810923 RepID=A0ABR4JIX9_9EURO
MLSRHDQACFATTRRLLATIINEGLATARVEMLGPSKQRYIIITNNNDCIDKPESWVRVGLLPDAYVWLKKRDVVSIVRPENLWLPVTTHNTTDRNMLDPEVIFDYMYPWLLGVAEESILMEIKRELKSTSANQVYSANSDPLGQYHKLCCAQSPLDPYDFEGLPDMITPLLAFVSVPRTDMLISGIFEETLESLLTRLDVPATSPDRLIVPCLAKQLPAVRLYFPRAIIIKTVSQCAHAQASMRTLTMRQELGFRYHIKLPLACLITGAIRTIPPWATRVGPAFSAILEKCLPPDLWVFNEVGGVVGSQDNQAEATHLSCVLRDDLETRARSNNETLFLTAALEQHPLGSERSYAQILFNLETRKEILDWIRRYVSCLFRLVLPPLINHGIGLEAHGQNLVARVCRQTRQIKGFAVRDFCGIRFHLPTLQKHGFKSLKSLRKDCTALTNDLHNVCAKWHHTVVQTHVAALLASLGLANEAGWVIVRHELLGALDLCEGVNRLEVGQFLLKDTMAYKCVLKMRIRGEYNKALGSVKGSGAFYI